MVCQVKGLVAAKLSGVNPTSFVAMNSNTPFLYFYQTFRKIYIPLPFSWDPPMFSVYSVAQSWITDDKALLVTFHLNELFKPWAVSTEFMLYLLFTDFVTVAYGLQIMLFKLINAALFQWSINSTFQRHFHVVLFDQIAPVRNRLM